MHLKQIIVFLSYVSYTVCQKVTEEDVVVYTVASNTTDGYSRFLRSSHVYDIPVNTLGLNKKWKGGTMSGAGGGYKINLLKKAIEAYKESEQIILFTDGYDVLFLSKLNKILENFKKSNARILFGAEHSCWPDKKLSEKYPPVANGPRYLNSGGFIGYSKELLKLLNYRNIDNEEDDQLFYTEAFLDTKLREQLNIKLDYKSKIFQNLYGAYDEVELLWENDQAILVNKISQTRPSVVHGNGLSKMHLNHLGNYLAQSWLTAQGCQACNDDIISLSDLKEDEYPTVLLAIFIPHATPFFEEFLTIINNLKYPSKKIHLFFYNNVPYHEKAVKAFIETAKYQSVKQIRPSDGIAEATARELAFKTFSSKNLDYYFNVDGEARLDNSYALRILIEQNRTIVAPLLVRPYKAWSNFWGALTDEGYYARSSDYMDIINNVKRGLWNVPYISSCYLVNGTLIKNLETRPLYVSKNLDPDMEFCRHNREKGTFMFVTNRVDFGHLVDSDDYDTTPLHPDFHNIFQNQWEWEKRYIHENYSQNLDQAITPKQPCPDVFWFPTVSPRFCQELIETMENFGKWSDGSNKDERLTGGYEAVPTRDIHMNQVGMEKQWLHFLKLYVLPLNQRVFAGYQDSPPRSLMNFVVRYKPDEQPSLRPHHDTSTYTINIALNTPKVDYEGGGCRFIRYNCSVKNTKLGWLLMHPGRLTHYHEGLLVTKGTRYIMISFIDP